MRKPHRHLHRNRFERPSFARHNRRIGPAKNDPPETKIWRYVDFTKFQSLVFKKSLYFACPLQFNDPFESYLPRSHIAANRSVTERIIRDSLSASMQIAAMPGRSPDGIQRLKDVLTELSQFTPLKATRETMKRFGISCWHKNEHESEAMWRLYSSVQKPAIAIESTIGQLRDALKGVKHVLAESVRYMDFDKDSIEKGRRLYMGFIKRNSFEHEREFRASILLPEERWQDEEGMFVPCDLDILINQIHTSPLATEEFKVVVNDLCRGVCNLQKLVVRSSLLDEPDYGNENYIDQEVVDSLGQP